MSLLDSGLIGFSLSVDRLLPNTTQNVVFSPFSLSIALAMTLMGTQNKSGEELSTLLFGQTIRSDEYPMIANEYRFLVDKCLETNGQVMSTANFLYSHKDYPILQTYKQLIETNFAAKIQELDFSSKNREAVDTINSDISTATKGKIPTLFAEIDPKTKMVLANALYFKGLWKSKFIKDLTKVKKFTTNDKNEIDVQMMYQTMKIPFVISEQLNCRAIELSYDNSNVVMVVLLPDENSTVTELKNNLNSETLDVLMNGMTTSAVKVHLPKFKIESTLPLFDILSKAGIKQIFDPTLANFSGITSDPLGLYVGDVLQKVIIEVNEDGTEAAAATGVVAVAVSATIVLNPKVFMANRPFMFLLISKYEANKNVLLFTGTVNNPND